MMDFPFNFDSAPTAYCVVHAAREYSLPPEALLAMMMQENGRPGTKKKNSNGSYDLGVMQINTVWLQDRSPLKYYLNENQLAYDTCANIHTAAWILAMHYAKSRDIWRAIGMYHSPGTLLYANRYVASVYRHLPKARHLISSSRNYGYYVSQFYAPSPLHYNEMAQTENQM